ncbi:MAG: SHOCT domain-containing protein [Microbacteriaceae bacterium]|nr:SHOCT domain-containing protein [Burkholderiaceae bacterium]
MRQLSAAGQQLIHTIAQRHGFSVDGTLSMLDAVINGNGSMAQFNHPDFAGSGQWMRGGMTMVSDMFNNHLKGRVNSLCAELSNLVANQPELVRSGSFQSQNQGNGAGHGQQQTSHSGPNPNQNTNQNTSQNTGQNTGQGSSALQGGIGFGPACLIVPPAPGTTGDWWPADLRWPNSTGSQNNVRYAYFAQARRLVIDIGGTVTVYDTLDHQIGGFSQQQSVAGTLSFNSQYGLMDVASLPVISSNGRPPRAITTPVRKPTQNTPQNMPQNTQAPAWSAAHAAPSASPVGRDVDIFASIERLADLRSKGLVSDDEFSAKKAELLSRL